MTYIDRLTTLEKRLEECFEDCQNLKSDNEHLWRRVSDLEASSDFKILRNRFISTFRRDKLHNATDADHLLIAKGDRSAHEGNAIRDAEVYDTSSGRKDFGTYQTLYGLHPGIVRMITYPPTILALSKHATVLASNRSTGTSRFHQLFAEFISALQESEFASGYLEDKSTKVAAAYRAFMNCIGQEVREVEDLDNC